ncbi:MAG: spore coat protein [Syntrophomonadaceae bacterium]|nr:spore coat protein [Syntrophomonadaceae bacterium]
MDTGQTVTTKTGVIKIGKPVSNQLPKVKDPSFNIRDCINDLLLTEKHNLVSYQIAINEMINDDLRQVLQTNRDRIQNLQVTFFNELFNLGEYQADLAESLLLNDTVDVFTNYKGQLPPH